MGTAGFLVACSDDTAVEPLPVPETGSPDSPIITPPMEAGPDTSPPFDGGFTVDNFDNSLADSVCKALARCCYGSATPPAGSIDGGSFDMATCASTVLPFGFEGSNFGTALRDAGNVTVDQVAADNCIKKVQAMTCNLPGSEFKEIRTACFKAYQGKNAPGAACAGSIECAAGNFCKTVDGGPGTCEPLRAANGNCGDFTAEPASGEEACSYRRGGDTGNHCHFFDEDAGVVLPPGSWKCQGGSAVGGHCKTSIWCTEAVCEFDNKCTSPDMYWATSCDAFLK